jgi:hypothetical protein
VRPLHTGRVEHGREIAQIGPARKQFGHLDRLTATRAARIHADHLEAGASQQLQPAGGMPHLRKTAAHPVQHDHGRAAAVQLVVDADAVYQQLGHPRLLSANAAGAVQLLRSVHW